MVIKVASQPRLAAIALKKVLVIANLGVAAAVQWQLASANKETVSLGVMTILLLCWDSLMSKIQACFQICCICS